MLIKDLTLLAFATILQTLLSTQWTRSRCLQFVICQLCRFLSTSSISFFRSL